MPLEHRQTPTRRGALLSALASAGTVASSVFWPALAGDGPPPLGNGRHQFTEIDPVQPLPALALPDRHGKPTPLRSNASVTLIHIWATWCPACRPDLAALQEAWRARPPFAILTICTDEWPPAALEHFLRIEALEGVPVLLDPGGRAVTGRQPDGTASPIQPIALPMSYVVDRDGGVRGYVAGVIDWGGADARALLAFYERA